MKNYNKVTLLIFLSIILFIVLPLSLNFTIYSTVSFTIINFLAYILFWAFPVSNLYKNKSNIKKYIALVLIYSILAVIIWFAWEIYWKNNHRSQIDQARDSTRVSDYFKVKNIILNNKNIKFNTISDINDKLDVTQYTIADPSTCYYFKNNSWNYIFALNFQSEKYKIKFWNPFIFKSNETMVITQDEIIEINRVINNKCDN